MAVSKPKDSADKPAEPPRSEDEVKRLRDAVLFAWEHLHTVVKNNGGNPTAAAAPSSLQQVVGKVQELQQQKNQAVQQSREIQQHQVQQQSGSSKPDGTRPSSLNRRDPTFFPVRGNKQVQAQSRL